jgi:ATP-dependent Clp protease ATP-binding subunit ClpA
VVDEDDGLDLWHYTMDGRRVIFFARQAMDQFGGRELMAEHLLLGLLNDDVVAAEYLARLPVSLNELRADIAQSLRHVGRAPSFDVPVSGAARKALRKAREEARQLAHAKVFSGHILLAIVLESTSEAADRLRRHVDVSDLRQWLNLKWPLRDEWIS